MNKNLLPYLLLLFPFLVTAQPELILDYNEGEPDAFECFLCTEQQTARVGTGIVTVAQSAATGSEPCLLVDGQFSLLKDINPGEGDGGISFLTSRDGLAYFAALDPVNGGAVWVSDGTEEGTEVYFDPDPANTFFGITDMEFSTDEMLYVVMGPTLYRFADGVGTELASGVNLSTSRDNFPGVSITTY